MALREIVTRDFGWKLFSVALAVAIWLTVHSISEDASRRVNPSNGLVTKSFQDVPVTVVSAATDVHELKAKPGTIQVTVSGKPEAFIALDPGQILVLVVLTGAEAALDLRRRVEVSTPPGITFVSAVPTEVDVVVPPRKNK